MKPFKLTQFAVATALICGVSISPAQEGTRPSTVAAIAVTSPAPISTSSAKACFDGTLIYLLDITGSFTDHLINKDLFANSIKRVRSDSPKPCIGSEVKVSIIGHSHRDVTQSYDHLASSNYTITRNHYTAENINAVVVKQLQKWVDELASGKMKPQSNTAVAMAFDNVAELVQLRGKPAIIWAITDGDETELGGVPAPFKPKQLAGATIYMLGAGVTLPDGTTGQRKLRTDWERHFRQAGADKFYWVSKP